MVLPSFFHCTSLTPSCPLTRHSTVPLSESGRFWEYGASKMWGATEVSGGGGEEDGGRGEGKVCGEEDLW